MVDKYGTGQDPYCFDNSCVLINKLNITDDARLEQAEQEITIAAIDKINFNPPPYDFEYLKNIHRIIFASIYSWAGEVRIIDMSKGDTRFCHASRIEPEAEKIFTKLHSDNYFVGLSQKSLVEHLAILHDDINILHPFREGNGRTLRVFFEHIVLHCGYGVDWLQVTKDEWLTANQKAFYGDFGLLKDIFERVILVCGEIN